jgi:hypothetical protein
MAAAIPPFAIACQPAKLCMQRGKITLDLPSLVKKEHRDEIQTKNSKYHPCNTKQ